MGRYNDLSTALGGIETTFASSREVLLDAPTKQAAMRFETAALTPANLTLYLAEVVGNPGLSLEIVDDLNPVVSSTIYVPTSDQLVTNWLDQGGGAATFADIDDRFNSAEYLRNTNALAATGSLTLLSRGSAAYAALAATRILGVRVGAVVMLGANSANAAQCTVEASLNLGTASVYYSGPRRSVAKTTQGQTVVPLTATLAQPVVFPDLGSFAFDPSTGLPWTMATINNLIAATANYGWGLTVRGKIAAGGFAVSGTWIEVFTCAENRLGYYQSVTAPRAGWTRYALSGAAALSADTWYWLTVSCPYATQAAFARLPVIRPQRVNQPATAAGTGEHRTFAMVKLGAPAAVPYTTATTPTNADGDTEAVARSAGEMFPCLLESAGPTVEPPSQAYAYVDLLTIDSSTVATLYGQQYTAAGNQAYGGVQLPILWGNLPDRPLVVEVRSGGGAITGAGTLHATATISPDSQALASPIFTEAGLTASPLKAQYGVTIIAPFDGGAFNATSGTQYFIIVKSNASPAKGWRMPRCDTRSDNIGSGPSVANIEGASQGGQTDSYFASGSAADRYDLPIALVAAPTPPVGNAVPFAEVTGDIYVEAGLTNPKPPSVRAPGVLVSWSPTSLTTSFLGYRVYRRKRGTPVEPFVLVADYPVGEGQTATVVEAQHTRFQDWEAAWMAAAGLAVEGWDYAFTVRHTNGLESFIGSMTDLDNDLVPASDAWVTCNAAPYLNAPLRVINTRRVESDTNQIVEDVAGRDFGVVRTIDRIPRSRLRISWQRLGRLTDEILRSHRWASMSGRQLAFLDCQGQQTYGVLEPPGFSTATAPTADLSSSLTITGVAPRVTDYNLPAEVKLDGTNDFVTTPDNTSLDPSSTAFSFWVAGRFTDTAGAYYLSKGNIAGAADGYAIRRNAAGSVQAFVNGASASGGAAIVDGGWFDGTMQVAVGTYDGATVTLYQISERGGFATASTVVAAGAITNAVALVAGADNAGASGFTTSSIRAWGVHVGKAYSESEARSLGRYLCEMFGYQPPAGATVFFDLADDRSWDGVGTTIVDVAGSGLTATLSGSPATRGRPWPLSTRSRW